MTIPKGADYLNFGSFLEVNDFEHALNSSQFESAKHLQHSRGWGKVLTTTGQVATATSISQSIFLQV